MDRPLIKRLYAKSGNKCAFPGCKNPLIFDEVNQSEMAHIISSKPKGPRHIDNFNNGDFDTEDNLMVLCLMHHNLIDTQWKKYPDEMLRNMKAMHEKEVKNAVNGLNANSIFIKTYLEICAKNNVTELLSQNLVTAFRERLFEDSKECEDKLKELTTSTLSVAVDRLILSDIMNFNSILRNLYIDAAAYCTYKGDGIARPEFQDMACHRERRDYVENNINYLISIYNKYRFMQLS